MSGTPGVVSLSNVIPSTICSARSPIASTYAAISSSSSSETANAFAPASHSWSWSIQFVCTFASRSAFSRYRSSRSGVSGHAPTTVWRIRYASFGSRQPATRGTDQRLPRGRVARDRGEPSAHVAAALGVVRRRREQAAGRARQVGRHGSPRPRARSRRVSADLVQRHEAVPAVERRVLDALRVHGRRRLLEADDERVVAALLEQQDPRELVRQTRGLDRGTVLGGDEPCVRLDVGAVDVERRERPRRRRRRRAASRPAARPRRRTSSAPARASPRRRPRRTAAARRSALVEPRQRLLGGRVDEERRDVVQELVAGRPLDRPLRRAAARRARGSSRPRRASIPASRSRSR